MRGRGLGAKLKENEKVDILWTHSTYVTFLMATPNCCNAEGLKRGADVHGYRSDQSIEVIQWYQQ